jgi:hypothetical protein
LLSSQSSRKDSAGFSPPRTSPQKYLLPYWDQLSSQGTLYRVLLSPKSQDHFSFWPFVILIQDQKVFHAGFRDAYHLQFRYQKAEGDANISCERPEGEHLINQKRVLPSPQIAKFARTQADFIYHMGPDWITIADTGLGKCSVADDLESVLRKIEYWHQGLGRQVQDHVPGRQRILAARSMIQRLSTPALRQSRV